LAHLLGTIKHLFEVMGPPSLAAAMISVISVILLSLKSRDSASLWTLYYDPGLLVASKTARFGERHGSLGAEVLYAGAIACRRR